MSDEAPVVRWTAKRKTAVVIDILKGKTTAAEVARKPDLRASDVEAWMEEAERNMENDFRSRPGDVREQYEAELRGSGRR